jgi:hypothetical protein
MLNVKYEYICPVSGYSSFRTRFEKGIRLESETVSAAVTFVTLFKYVTVRLRRMGRLNNRKEVRIPAITD